MKRFILILVLGLSLMPGAQALELLRWERLPLAVPLIVGQERVIFIDPTKTIRVGIPASLSDRLRVQSAGGVIYLRASAPIEPVRLQLQDAKSGELILLDITAKPASAAESPLEPIQIVDGERENSHERSVIERQLTVEASESGQSTPVPVVLTRYAAQSLYAPLRTIEPVEGIETDSVRDLALDTLLPTLTVRAQALAAWRLNGYWVTAVKLTNTRSQWLTLDPRALQGDFIGATFQHSTLGPAGDATDTTVAYLVTRGSGLADALLPALPRIDSSLNAPPAVIHQRADHEE